MQSFHITINAPYAPIDMLLFAESEDAIKERLANDLPNTNYSIKQYTYEN